MSFLPVSTARRWKEAASLIVTARQHVERSSESGNYAVLLMERGKKAKFAKGAHVFPGGVLDKADASGDWTGQFSRLLSGSNRVTFETLEKTACCHKNRAPPTFSRLRQDDEEISSTTMGVPAEVAFKICSLRETFEESGLLLARRVDDVEYKDKISDSSSNSEAGMAQTLSISTSDREYWTERVRKDASQFFAMCQALDCVPDIWSIHLWSTWLTPSNSKLRYDTPFFITSLPEVPELCVNHAEHDSKAWVCPTDAMGALAQGDIVLGPPQVMEMLRLARHTDCSGLIQFAARRAREHGSERWCPLRIKCADAAISMFPGDSQCGNFSSGDAMDCTALEFLSRSKNVHALVQQNAKDFRFYCNIPERRGHLFPRPHGSCPPPVPGAV